MATWRRELREDRGHTMDRTAGSVGHGSAQSTAIVSSGTHPAATAGSDALAVRDPETVARQNVLATAASSAAASTANRTAIAYDPSGPGGLTYAPKRKQASVVEMLEYVKGLDIDPIKEADMLWIAEEAFNAPLPPGWSEHQDEQSRVYFHNSSTGESTWRHPMDDLFREVVDYQRRVQGIGGFWEVEDEIADLEDSIRRDLADWMELFDEHGEKFFYNRRTDESRFDDPRMAVYHRLYARIKMVAKMKERLPVLARAQRPQEPTEQELELKRRQEEEEAKYLRLLIRIQSMARVIIAKKKVRQAMAKAVVQKGPQPLKGKLRLRMEKLGPRGEKDLVLSQTTPHRRSRAATKIQSRMRGVLARKRFRPLVIHRAYLSKLVIKVQSIVRRNLAKRRVAKMRAERRVRAAIRVQRIYRAYRDRQYVSKLKTEKVRFNWMLKCVETIQTGFRMALAKKRVREKKFVRYNGSALTLQRKAKQYMAARELSKWRLIDEPIQAVFVPTTVTRMQHSMPWVMQLWAAPWAAGTVHRADLEEKQEPFVNLFSKAGIEHHEDLIATKIQARARGALLRKHKDRCEKLVMDIVKEIWTGAWEQYDFRSKAAAKLQKVSKGAQLRKTDVVKEKRKDFAEKNVETIRTTQAYFMRYVKQDYLQDSYLQHTRNRSATLIQAQWRGWLARRHCERLRDEGLWPAKAWFEYTATGPDSVQVEVRFLPNPDFDDYHYFLKYGTHMQELYEDLEDLDKEVTFCVDEFLASERAIRPTEPEGGFPALSPRPQPVEEVPEEAPVEEKRAGSKAPAPKRKPRSDDKGSDGRKVQVEEAPEAEPKARAKGGARPKPKAKAEPKAAESVPSIEVSQPASPAAPPPVAKAKERPKAQAKPQAVRTEPAPARSFPGADKLGESTASTFEEQSTFMPSGEVAMVEFASTTPGVSPGVSPAAASVRSQSTGMSKAKSKPKAKTTPSRPAASASAPSLHSTAPGTLNVPGREAPVRPSPKPKSASGRMSVPAAQEEPLDVTPPVHLPAIMPKAKRRASPKASARDRKPLFEEGLQGEAHLFLKEAPRKYVDVNPEPNQRPSPKPPPSHSPQPPSPSGRTVAVAAASSQAAALRASQSTGAIEGAPKEGESGAIVSAIVTPAPKRKTYGGTLVGKQFVRNKAENIEAMPEKEQQEVLEDIRNQRAQKEQELVERKKFHKERRKKEAEDKINKYRNEMDKAEAEEAERQKKKAKELKKWLKKKEEESKARRARDEEIMEQVMQKESEKSEQLRKLEKQRLEERERRLRIAEKQKAKLEAQMLATRAERMARIRAGGRHPMEGLEAQSKAAWTMPDLQQYEGVQQQMPPGEEQPAEEQPAEELPKEEQAPEQTEQTVQEQPQEKVPQELSPSQKSMQSMPMMPSQQRVVHRHIHHHVHYHEGADAGGDQGMMHGDDPNLGYVDPQQRRAIEMQSEARVRDQLEASGQAPGPPAGAYGSSGSMQRSLSEHIHQHHGMPGQAIDPAAETPTNLRRHSSMAAMSGVDRTQEAFHKGSQPALGGAYDMEFGKRKNLPAYGASVGRAFSSYADSGRPRLARPAAAAIIQERGHAM